MWGPVRRVQACTQPAKGHGKSGLWFTGRMHHTPRRKPVACHVLHNEETTR